MWQPGWPAYLRLFHRPEAQRLVWEGLQGPHPEPQDVAGGLDQEVQEVSGEEGNVQVLGEIPGPEADTILVEFHMAGNQVQVGKQEVQNAAHRVGRSRLGTGAVGDSQEEPDEEPEEVVAVAGIEEEDPGQVLAVACSVP